MAVAPIPEPKRRLRVIDGLGEAHDLDDVAILPEDYANQERAMVKIRRENAGLRAALTRMHATDPDADVVEGLLNYWRDKLYHPRADVPLDGRRADAVRKALRWCNANPAAGDGPTRIRAAIDGCAAKPYVGPKGRCAEPGPGCKRHDDLVLILQDETNLARFAGYAASEAEVAALDAYKRALWARLKAEPVLVATLASLGREPRAEVIVGAVRWAAAERAAARAEWLGNPS